MVKIEIIKIIEIYGGGYDHNGDIPPMRWFIEFKNEDYFDITFEDSTEREFCINGLWQEEEDVKKWSFDKWYYLNLFVKHRKEFIRKFSNAGEDPRYLITFFKWYIKEYFEEKTAKRLIEKYKIK